MDAAGKKMKEAENNLQKNRLSIGSLFFYLQIYLSCFYSCICKIRKYCILLYKKACTLKGHYYNRGASDSFRSYKVCT
jgi:hypothetical protein